MKEKTADATGRLILKFSNPDRMTHACNRTQSHKIRPAVRAHNLTYKHMHMCTEHKLVVLCTICEAPPRVGRIPLARTFPKTSFGS